MPTRNKRAGSDYERQIAKELIDRFDLDLET
jgi:hypothetical protein